MHLHLGSAVAFLHFLARGKRRDRLGFLQCAAFCIVLERSDRALNLINDVGAVSPGMECEMPRAGAGLDGRKWRVIGSECARFRVEMIDEELIKTQVGGDSEAVVLVDIDRVRM